jgi:hypothetical protein
MDSNENPISVPPQEELDEMNDLVEVKKPTSLLVAQFFLFPLIIIAFGVGIFVLFGYVAYDETTPGEYLSAIRSSGGYFDRQRWQAAAQMSNVIATQADELKGTAFADDLLAAYVDAQSTRETNEASTYQDPLMELLALDPDESQLRRFLAVSLGYLEHAPAVPALTRGLADPDAETQIWTLWALGMINDPSAAPSVVGTIDSSDVKVRQMAAYVLGVLKNPLTIRDLKSALGDPAADVQWTVAMSLAQMGDASGSELLVAVTDRKFFDGFAEMSDGDKEAVITNAVHCLGLLRLDSTRAHLALLSENDPSLKVRDAAITALELY